MANMEIPKVVEKPVPIITHEDLAKIIKACAGVGERVRPEPGDGAG